MIDNYAKLVLMRHCESYWNRDYHFAGWIDVDLTPKGVDDAYCIGGLLTDMGFKFDLAYSSKLVRAIRTMRIVLETMDLSWIPQQEIWRLNERHYGALQGMSKAEAIENFSFEQVEIWHRHFAARPPKSTERNNKYVLDSDFESILRQNNINGESIKDTLARLRPFWEGEAANGLRNGKNILCVSHSNTLKAFLKCIFHISDLDIINLTIPNGNPLVIAFNRDLRIKDFNYLNASNDSTVLENVIGGGG